MAPSEEGSVRVAVTALPRQGLGQDGLERLRYPYSSHSATRRGIPSSSRYTEKSTSNHVGRRQVRWWVP